VVVLTGLVALVVAVAVLPTERIAREQARTCDTVYLSDISGLPAPMLMTVDIRTGRVLSKRSQDGAAVHTATICGPRL